MLRQVTLIALVALTVGMRIPPQPPIHKVGDPAPKALSVDEWLKGDPVTKLNRGTVYLIEFWGTWCAPCIESIPRLSELQRKHRDKGLVVIGVASHEWDGIKPVKAFLKKNGYKMDYRVAFDGDLSMEHEWQNGGIEGRLFNMPEAFVVDRQGKIAWIGHPLKDDGKPLHQAVDRAMATAAPANDEGLGWTMERLDLDVSIQPRGAKVLVEGKMELRLDDPSSMGPTLAMNSSQSVMRFTRIDGPPGVAVELNAKHESRRHTLLAHVRFDSPRVRGDKITLTFAAESGGKRSDYLAFTKGIAFGQWTNAWYPLAVFKEGSLSKKMAVPGTTRFHMPPGGRSLSNGRLVDRTETDDEVIEVWEVSDPVARSFIVGPYKVARHAVGEQEVAVYLLSKKPTSAKDQAKALAEAIGAMEARFGPFPYPGYSIAEVPEGTTHWYAASQQGFIMAKRSAFEPEGGNLPLFAHEAAHAWWGNLVNTRGPGSILCSESLAQYSAVVAIEALEGVEAATEFLRFSRPGYSSRQCARGYFDMQRAGQDMPMSQLEGGGWQHNLSDAKGHWMYHMLRRRVGDEVFFTTLRGLIGEYAGKRMALDDVRSAFVSACSSCELEQFFAQWLDRPGAPVLDLDYTPNDNGTVKVVIEQVQEGEPYHLNVDVAVDSASGTRMHTVSVRGRRTETILSTKDRPTDVRLDPNHRLLIWKPEYGRRP